MSSTTAGRPFDTFDTPPLQFLGEQNGVPERRLKEALADLLRNDRGVTAAWLARVLYDGQTPGVVLGLAADRDGDEHLVEQIGRIFSSMFDDNTHLDIVFLSSDQQADIRIVCPAFYRRARWWWPWS